MFLHAALLAAALWQSATPSLPATPLTFGFFTARFSPDGAFRLEGLGWPTFNGTWTLDAGAIELISSGVRDCDGPGRYRVHVEARRVRFELLSDACVPRRMILDRSVWRPAGEAETIPARSIARSVAKDLRPLPAAASSAGSWPSFRGPAASGVADGQRLPESWDVAGGRHVRWRAPIPGLGHSSPVVWGDRVFVTTAVSSRGSATFKPGLYGDGDASDDRSPHRWMLLAFDTASGKKLWERVAHEGPPVDTRHIKSTYASATPATDGRTVVAWFGSQGLFAYDVNGSFRWRVDLGRMYWGAYDIPTFEWGPASSPIIWNGLVIVQVDTHGDDFLLALDAETGAVKWQTDRDELPSWGTPTVADTADGPQLVTNASKLIRGYDPRSGRELWRLGGSSLITAPTPVFGHGLFVVASGRAPERPLFAIKPTARGDITLAKDATSNAHVVWSRTGRGSYMPTPLIYKGIVYVLANNGVFDAYDIETGAEIYRQRLPHLGSGFSASPVASDDRIFLSSEDGEVLVIAAGREFKLLGTSTMGELLMATPAISDGVLYIRTANSLFAISSASARAR